MTAQTFAPGADLACGRCGMTTDLCLSMKDECCVGCTHYPEPIEAHRLLYDKGKSISQIAALLGATERSVDRWNQGHTRPISRRPGGCAMSTTDELLAKATSHPSKRVQSAAQRAKDAVEKVRGLLAEDAGKAEARDRVARLERELREAKAALRGSAPVSASGTAIDSKAVRAWARESGAYCPPIGRVPGTVIAAYNAAQESKAS